MELDGVWRDRGASPRRLAGLLGSAVAAGQVAQLVWLTAGSRVLSSSEFGAVLAAQAVYGVLQYVTDNGPAFYGARLAARGALDDEGRGGIAGVRLVLAAVAAVAAAAIGAVSGTSSLLATAPFVAALFLYALLGYWEPFGRGDGRPWSAYVFLRGAAPATVACLALALGTQLPLFAPGLAEVVAIAMVAIGFRLRPLALLRLALTARERPWRSVAAVGTPSVLWPVAVGAGTVLLNAFGAPAAAAVYAVGMRIVTGLAQVGGVVAFSIFPRLASEPASKLASTERLARIGLVGVLSVAAAACSTVVVAAGLLARVLLAHGGSRTETTLILMTGSAAAVCLTVVLTSLLMAAGRERALAGPYLAGTGIVVGAGLVVAALAPHSEAAWMAGVFLAGESLCALLLGVHAAGSVLGRNVVAGALATSTALGIVMTIAAVDEGARTIASVTAALVATGAAVMTMSAVRRSS